MGADQEGTYAALRVFRTEAFTPTVAAHAGTVVKSMGDGWLVEFASALDAAGCALAIQQAVADVGRFQLRIGLSIGDIIHDQDDIFGDGVNVASRLQEIAPPGGIAITGAVYESLDGTLSPRFRNAGLQTLKNVARPVQVWLSAANDETISAGVVGQGGDRKPLKLSVIAPTVQDDRPDLMSLMADVTTDVVRMIGSSDLIAPHPSPRAATGEARLSGKLRASGDRLRLDISLQTAFSEEIWSGSYDGQMTDVFTWQDRVVSDVSLNVAGALVDDVRERLFDAEPGKLETSDLQLSALIEFFDVSAECCAAALIHLERALELAPDDPLTCRIALRMALAADLTHCAPSTMPDVSTRSGWAATLTAGNRSDPLAALHRGIHTNDFSDTVLATSVDHALHLAPFDPDVLCLAGLSLLWLGVPDRATECFQKFEKVGRFNALSLSARAGLAVAMIEAGRDHAARLTAMELLRMSRDSALPFRALAAASAHLGHMEDARKAIAELRRLMPGETLAGLSAPLGYRGTKTAGRFLEGLRLAGLPES